MRRGTLRPNLALAAATVLAVWTFAATVATATAPCGDFGECKVLIEINATDGDIGFHFLKDGDDLVKTRITDPNGDKIFQDRAKGALTEQKYTEIFGESAEPLCWPDPEADPDEEIVTLEEFLERWAAGTYKFIGFQEDDEKLVGESQLTYDLPAAPTALAYDDTTGEISWAAGDALGECATNAELDGLVADGVLPTHPEAVPVAAWEVVLESEDEPALKFSVRVAPEQTSVTVPEAFLDNFNDDTPGKIEVGAIGADDNATFSEKEVCINEDEGCGEED